MNNNWYIGQSVRVFKYGSWYRGIVKAVGRTRVQVLFHTKTGKPKLQYFAMDAPWSIKGGSL